MNEEAPNPTQVVVRLVQGLPAKQAIGILASSVRDTGIERRIQAFYLYDMKKRGSYQELGFTNLEHMTRVKLEMSASLTRELALCGRALEELELIDRAFAEGRISWTKVRHLLRIAVPETEALWLARAFELSARELQLEIKGSEHGRPPRKDKKGLPTVKFKSELEFDAVEHEVWELAMKKVRQETGEALDEKAVLLALAEDRLRKQTRSGDPDSRRLDDSLFRVVIDQCSTCRESSVRTDEGPIALDQGTAETLACDAPPAVVVGSEGDSPRTNQQGLSPRRRREILVRDGHRCRFCQRSEDVHVHHIVFRSQGGDHGSRNLLTLCKHCHSMVHEGFLQIAGQAPQELIFLDRDGMALARPTEPATGARRFATRVANGRTEVAREEVTFSELPRGVNSAWWGHHAHLFAWNERRKVLEFTAECLRDQVPPEVDEPDEPSGTRPPNLDAIIGQERAVHALDVAVRSARIRGCPVDHILLCGPPGLGKTTLARAVAREMGRRTLTTSGAALTDAAALVGLLAQLSNGDVLFLDEIHALPRKIAEMLYEAMEDLKVSLPVVCGTEARTLTLELEPMTVIGATTDQDRMPAPLLARFGIQQEVDSYSEDELIRIVERAVRQEQLAIDENAARALAHASHGTPRKVLALLRRARDEALSHAQQIVDMAEVRASFAAAGLDERGLGPVHQKAISVLQHRKKPLGVARLAALLGVSKRTFRKIHEPDLMRLGLVAVTPRGLVANQTGQVVMS